VKAIVEALIAATNLAYLVENESMCKELKRSAQRTLNKLHRATDRVMELREAECRK